MINRDVLDVVLESMDLIVVDTEEVAETLESHFDTAFSTIYEESIMNDIYEDEPEWDFTFYDTMSIIENDYKERLQIYNENMLSNYNLNNKEW